MTCLVTFDTASSAVMFERTGRKEGFAVKIVPVPRSISSSCGFACEFPCESTEGLRLLCETHKIQFEDIHKIV